MHYDRAKMPSKLRLQLAYYLQLQDRIDEALSVFKSVDTNDQGLCQIKYDYMYIYFMFLKTKNYKDVEQFKKLRGIVQNYVDY